MVAWKFIQGVMLWYAVSRARGVLPASSMDLAVDGSPGCPKLASKWWIVPQEYIKMVDFTMVWPCAMTFFDGEREDKTIQSGVFMTLFRHTRVRQRKWWGCMCRDSRCHQRKSCPKITNCLKFGVPAQEVFGSIRHIDHALWGYNIFVYSKSLCHA